MKKIILSLTIIINIFILCFSSFAGEGYEDLCEMIHNNKFNGKILKTSTGGTFGPNIGDEWTSKSKITSPKWFKYGNDYYLILETETDQVEDDNGKKSGYYIISEYVSDEIVVASWNGKYQAYYFDSDGICGSAITNDKNVVVEFKSDGTVSKGYEIEIDIDDIGLPVHDSSSFDGSTKGLIDKDENIRLCDGYWIFDKGNGKYDLYKANSSGSSSTVSSATNKSAYELYTIINNKKYTQKAIEKDPNKNNSNNTNNTNTTNNKSNTTTTNNVDKSISVESNSAENNKNNETNENKENNSNKLENTNISTGDNLKNKFNIKVANGKLQLTPKTGKICGQGKYKNKNNNKYYEVDLKGLINKETTSVLENATEINGAVYSVGNNNYLVKE